MGYEVTGEGPLPQGIQSYRGGLHGKGWMKDVLWVRWGQDKGCVRAGVGTGAGEWAPRGGRNGQQSSPMRREMGTSCCQAQKEGSTLMRAPECSPLASQCHLRTVSLTQKRNSSCNYLFLTYPQHYKATKRLYMVFSFSSYFERSF